ncbi:MAG: acyl-CoA dehydrogenase [Deltaproteobacteria bacterium]|nr:MAG: acyl-CoA dehydrogenase [Deltaproteobacteria bacterium]TDJ04558.1 MAG: acyl-CoA dehydrogenase [Deltaproteobacteria bacterium]
MDFAFTEEQEELRATARDFLVAHSSSEQVRTAMQSELGYDPQVWKQIGAELGWPSVIIPEEFGGLGLGYVELIALLELMGSALLCAPFFSSVCLAANALLVGGSEEQKKEYLPGIAEGQTRATLAFTEANGRWDASGIEASARREGGDYVLSGKKSFVLDGHCADLLVVAARREGTTGEAGISLFALPAAARGVERRALPTMDQTRRLAEIELRDVRVPGSALMGQEGEGWGALSKTLSLAAIALSAEQVGGAQRCLDMSVEYAKQRVQFGRPIGSFQAIKHKCADMLVQVESARSASYYAGCVAAEDGVELPLLASLAKAYCSDAYFDCAANAIQIHGGVGFTWEYDVHLYFKRAKSSESFLGDGAYHREQVARGIGL